MPFHIGNFLNITTPILLQMNLTILEISDENGFITSDNPVLWLDPSIMRKDYPISFFGFRSPTLDIFFPISPHFLVELTWTQPENYVSVTPQMVDEINGMIVMFSEEFVVMNHNSPKAYWFKDL